MSALSFAFFVYINFRKNDTPVNEIQFCSQIIAFDELKTDYKNPIDQCSSLNPVSVKKKS